MRRSDDIFIIHTHRIRASKRDEIKTSTHLKVKNNLFFATVCMSHTERPTNRWIERIYSISLCHIHIYSWDIIFNVSIPFCFLQNEWLSLFSDGIQCEQLALTIIIIIIIFSCVGCHLPNTSSVQSSNTNKSPLKMEKKEPIYILLQLSYLYYYLSDKCIELYE